MTCIAGHIDSNKSVHIAGDGRTTSGEYVYPEQLREKVFSKGDFIFGIAGSCRVSNLIKHVWKIPALTYDGDGKYEIGQYIYNDFVNSIIAILKDNDSNKVKDSVANNTSSMLFAFRGKLFGMYSDYSVLEFEKYAAVGSGWEVASGALYAMSKGLSNHKALGHKRCVVEEAIRAAAKHSKSVDDNIYSLSMDKNGHFINRKKEKKND